jgi:hypothetical protein
MMPTEKRHVLYTATGKERHNHMTLGYFPNKTVTTRLKCKRTVEAFIMVIKIDITGACFRRQAQTCHNTDEKRKTQDHIQRLDQNRMYSIPAEFGKNRVQ